MGKTLCPRLATKFVCVLSCDGDSDGPAPSQAASVIFHIHGVPVCDRMCTPEGDRG